MENKKILKPYKRGKFDPLTKGILKLTDNFWRSRRPISEMVPSEPRSFLETVLTGNSILKSIIRDFEVNEVALLILGLTLLLQI